MSSFQVTKHILPFVRQKYLSRRPLGEYAKAMKTVETKCSANLSFVEVVEASARIQHAKRVKVRFIEAN